MSTWNDSYTSSSDFRVAHAEAELYDTYGRSFSVEAKNKTLDKFGYNPSLDTADGAVLVSGIGANVALPSTNSVTHVTAGSGDTMDVIIEGHYLDASGNLIFHVQTVTLTATTNKALTQPLARASRAYVPEGGVPTGPINVRIGSGGTSVLLISAGQPQTQQCGTSISYRDAFVILSYGGSVLGSNNAEVTFRIEHRRLFSPAGTAYTSPNWRPLTADWLLGNDGIARFPQESPMIVPPNTDLRITASATANSTKVTAFMDGYLAVDQSLADAADPAAA